VLSSLPRRYDDRYWYGYAIRPGQAPVFLLLDGGVGGRNGGRNGGDVRAHHVFLEACAILLGAAIEPAAFLGDPYRVRSAAIARAAFLGVVRWRWRGRDAGAGILVRFKLGQAGTDTGEGRGLHQLGVGGGAGARFDGGEVLGLLLLLLVDRLEALGISEGDEGIEARGRPPGVTGRDGGSVGAGRIVGSRRIALASSADGHGRPSRDGAGLIGKPRVDSGAGKDEFRAVKSGAILAGELALAHDAAQRRRGAAGVGRGLVKIEGVGVSVWPLLHGDGPLLLGGRVAGIGARSDGHFYGGLTV